MQQLLGVGMVMAACAACAADKDEVMLNFVNADIESVVKAVGEISGKNFVIDPRVKGTVNIVSARPVPRALAYQILLSSLRLQGFAAVEGQGVVKIVPETDAKLHAGVGRPRRGDGDRLITKVFTLKNANANQLLAVVRPLVSPNNAVAAMAQTNALIVTDYADNLRRIEAIIYSVESAASEDMAVLPVGYGAAVDLATLINRLLQEGAAISGAAAGGGADSGKISIVPDARSNVLLVKADSAGKLAKVKSLLATLDQPSQAGGNVRVVYLKNAEAGKVAQTLRALLAQDGANSTAATARPAASSAPASTSAAGGNASPSTVPLANGSANEEAPIPGSIVQADTANNALIINAPDSMYQNLRNVIDLLDRRRAQVFVEALIVELSAARAAEFGVQWQGLSGFGKTGTQVVGGTNFPTANNPGIIATAIDPKGLVKSSGLNIGIVNGSINIPGIGNITNLGFLAKALETTSQANVLSTPTLMTLDNEEARIVVGQNVPFLTGQFSNTGGGATPNAPFQTFERKDVGLTLKLTPQITEGGLVRLKIFQEVSSVDPASLNSTAGITTNKRSIETAVQVDDGSIVAIGGLIQDDTSDGVDQVPLLGDIPGLGWLFKHRSKEHKRTNLMVFLKPTILRDEGGARALAGERYSYLLQDQQRMSRDKLPLASPGIDAANGSIHKTLQNQERQP